MLAGNDTNDRRAGDSAGGEVVKSAEAYLGKPNYYEKEWRGGELVRINTISYWIAVKAVEVAQAEARKKALEEITRKYKKLREGLVLAVQSPDYEGMENFLFVHLNKTAATNLHKTDLGFWLTRMDEMLDLADSPAKEKK